MCSRLGKGNGLASFAYRDVFSGLRRRCVIIIPRLIRRQGARPGGQQGDGISGHAAHGRRTAAQSGRQAAGGGGNGDSKRRIAKGLAGRGGRVKRHRLDLLEMPGHALVGRHITQGTTRGAGTIAAPATEGIAAVGRGGTNGVASRHHRIGVTSHCTPRHRRCCRRNGIGASCAKRANDVDGTTGCITPVDRRST
ncbi:MAG: hypothetical protein WAR97_13315 [Thiothrix eikelboomii]